MFNDMDTEKNDVTDCYQYRDSLEDLGKIRHLVGNKKVSTVHIINGS